MFRKMIASFTAVAAALLVVGVAWASNDSSPSASVGIDASAEGSVEATGDAGDDSPSTSLGKSTSSTTASESPSTSTGDETTTTSFGNTTSTLGDTTSTTVETTSTTSSSSSTSTSVGESADGPEDGRNTYTIPAVGTVTIEVRAGVLILVDVSAPGWNVDLEKVENDRVEIEFTAGLAEAEFEARIEGRSVDIDIEVESD